MKKERLMELAGVQLNEEYTQKDWDRTIKDLGRMIMEMAEEDAKGMEDDEYYVVKDQYTEDAINDLHEFLKSEKKK